MTLLRLWGAGGGGGRPRHLDERGCRRDLPVEVLLPLLLLDLQGKAGAENPLEGQKEGSCPADAGVGGRQAGRPGPGSVPWAPQTRSVPPETLRVASKLGGLSGPPLGVCSQGGPHPNQPPEPRGG